jgi:hypothetical protein
MTFQYAIEPHLTPVEFIDILHRSTLAERRPVDRPELIRAMLENASVIVTVRDVGRLVGVSRAISDFVYFTYLSDLAVDESCWYIARTSFDQPEPNQPEPDDSEPNPGC